MDLFEYFTSDNISGKKSTEKWLIKNNKRLYDDIIEWCSESETLKKLEFKKKIYHYVNKIITIPSCIVCGNMVKYKRFRDGYSDNCSDKCVKQSKQYKEKWSNSWYKNNSDGAFIEKRINTILDNYESIDEYKTLQNNSREKTMLEKYGSKYLFETESFKNNRKETLEKKYGDENWNNKEKTKSTRIKNGTQIDDSKILALKEYKKISINRTITIFRNNEKLINPKNLKRGMKKYHIDHRFSLKQAFLNDVPLEIISHPCNLKMIWWKDNLKKQDICEISLETLCINIINYEHNIIIKHSTLNEIYNNDNMKKISEEFLENIQII